MKLWKAVLALLAAAGLFYGGVIAAESPALSLKKVEVIGNSSGKVRASDVVSAGGLSRGIRLLELPTEKTARRIESLPWVSDAHVERILPSSIRVTIKERRPAYVAMEGLTPWLVDEAGVVLEQADRGLIHLWDLPLPPLRPGLKLDLRQFDHVVRILDSLPSALRTRLDRVGAASVDRITLQLTDGTAVIYGAAEEMSDKNYAARALLERYDAQGIPVETVDVRVPSRPAVKPKGG